MQGQGLVPGRVYQHRVNGALLWSVEVSDDGQALHSVDCTGTVVGTGCCAQCRGVWRGQQPAAGGKKQGSAQTAFNRHVHEELKRQGQPGAQLTDYSKHDAKTRARWALRRRGTRLTQQQQQHRQRVLEDSKSQLQKLWQVLQQRWPRYAQIEKDRLLDVARNAGREGKQVHGRRWSTPGSVQLARLVLLHAGQQVQR